MESSMLHTIKGLCNIKKNHCQFRVCIKSMLYPVLKTYYLIYHSITFFKTSVFCRKNLVFIKRFERAEYNSHSNTLNKLQSKATGR